MDSYTLSRSWFNWCFENPEKISPNHTAIYFFAIEHCNRLGWKNKFGFPTQMTMEALGIKKHQTYTRYFNDLCEWGFIKLIQKSQNQYSANIISLISAMPKNGKALDKANINHAAKQIASTGQSNGQSNSSIDKQINQLTNKQINQLTKVSLLENILMTELEIEKAKDFYQANYDEALSILSNYKFSSGKKYKSDYHALIGWVADRVKNQPKKENNFPQKNNSKSKKELADEKSIIESARFSEMLRSSIRPEGDYLSQEQG